MRGDYAPNDGLDSRQCKEVSRFGKNRADRCTKTANRKRFNNDFDAVAGIYDRVRLSNRIGQTNQRAS